jgi:hypothetical protein
MKHLLVARRLAVLVAVAFALLGWFGARHLNVPDAFGALMSRSDVQAGAEAAPFGAALPRGASHHNTLAAAAGKPVPLARLASAGNASTHAISETSSDRLAALRAPLTPEAKNDPFSVQSWLPPPPPPPAPVVAVVQEAPPTAPPLPFSYLGTLNQNKDKPQVFLANGEQLVIVSPGDVIDGRYRFESIAVTGAVFTYLPLNEKQVMTIEGEEKK